MKFSKDKMIKRLTTVGMADEIANEILAIMDNLDGQEVLPPAACWNNRVNGEPVTGVYGKDGEYYKVNIEDCE